MNILVTGANGQLGNEIRLESQQSTQDHYIFTDVIALEGVETTILDITKLEDVRKIVKEQDVKCIINCAAWTNVDKAETAGDIVETLNATAPENLALLKSTLKISYEQKIQASGVNYLIIRTAWLYSEFGHNFVKTMLNLTASKPQLKVVFDQTGTPTYAGDLATAIFDIIENRKYEGNTGVYHYSNEGVCSWYDFTVKIAELAGNTNCDIQPCHSNEFPSPVTRPAYSVLDKTKIKETFGIHVPYWVDSLKTCMRNMNVIKA